jgi:cytochrome c-type biogenesis protein CcmH/NrfF
MIRPDVLNPGRHRCEPSSVAKTHFLQTFTLGLEPHRPKELAYETTARIRRRILALALGIGCASLAPFGAIVNAQTEQGDRAKQVGGKFMCMCGCNQVLTQCNHVGCTVSTSMLKELDQHIAKGDSEAAITQAFVQEYGTQVYAEPPKSGLSLVAWSLPSVYLLIGTLVVIVVIWRWRARPGVQTASASVPNNIAAAHLEEIRRRVARDTED